MPGARISFAPMYARKPPPAVTWQSGSASLIMRPSVSAGISWLP